MVMSMVYVRLTHLKYLLPNCFRAIDLEVVKILRERVRDCQKREEVNHPERCREHVEKYMTAFKKYRSEGEWNTIDLLRPVLDSYPNICFETLFSAGLHI